MNRSLLTVLYIIFSCLALSSQISWSDPINIASSASGNNHPRISTDRSGDPLVIWYHASNAMFAKWEGTDFQSPRPLNSISMTVAGASWMGPDIASHGDTVYVVFKQTPEHTQHAWSMYSYDGGETFSDPVQLDIINDSLARFPTITTDDEGHPVAAFMKFNDQFLEATWVVTRSDDFGKSFNGDVLASKWSDPDAHVCDCCPGAVVSSGENVVMLYRDNNNNLRDTWAGFSVDGGETFIAGSNVDQHNWLINACPSTGPDGVIIGDTLYSVFMNAATGRSVVYLGKTSMSTFESILSTPVIPLHAGITQQNFPRIASHGNTMAISWKQISNGRELVALLLYEDITSDAPPVLDTVDLDNITNVDVALTNENVFVVWEDYNTGTVKYRSGTLDFSTSIVQSIDELDITVHQNHADHEWVFTGRDLTEDAQVILFDLQGRVVNSYKSTPGQNSLVINTAELIPGLFILKIQQDKRQINFKLVKQ